MSNFLDLRCPQCGDQDHINILAELWVRVTDDGTDPDASCDGERTFTPKSTTWCASCGHAARLSHFHSDEEARS